MTLDQLQQYLKDTGRYGGRVDGQWGKLTEGAILLALTDGPDTALTDANFAAAGTALDISPAAIKAFWKTEANGAGFQDGLPKILPERHYFSKLTAGRFDKSNPRVSYPKWGTLPYPKAQDDRYDLLLAMVRLDIDAGFASVSYGAPQIMGAHYKTCGYDSSFAFAEAMARDEMTQLNAFMAFVKSAGILPFLRKVDDTAKSWEPVAQRYNGTGYRLNFYHTRMAKAYTLYGGT